MAGFDATAPDDKVPGDSPEETTKLPEAQGPAKDGEYDRRGVLLPRRARVGGIITPQ